jgi:O-antigen/teichoic acid export membrane protein
LPSVIMLGLFPSLSYLYAHDRQRYGRICRRAAAGVSALGVLVAVAASLVAIPLVRTVLGPEYADTLPLFQVITLSLMFSFPNALLMYMLSASHRQRALMWVSATGAVFNVALNFALIPHMDAMGAAVSTIATEALMFTLLSAVILLRRSTHAPAQHAAPALAPAA